MTRATPSTIDLVLNADWLARLRASAVGGESTYLGKLLARGQSEALPEQAALDWRGLLEVLWGKPLEGWAGAAFALAAEASPEAAVALDEPARWWRADPVHLMAAIDHVRLAAAGASLGLREEDADSLVSALREHLGGAQLELVAPSTTRWYLRADRRWEARAVATAFAAGRDLRGLLATGPDATALLSLATECQMLLSQTPTNAAREARGVPTVNALWFWGGGEELAPEPAWRDGLPRLVSADRELLGAWHCALGGELLREPRSPATRRQAALDALGGRGDALVVLDAAYLELSEAPSASRAWLEALIASVVARRGRRVRLVAGTTLWELPTGLRARPWWPAGGQAVNLADLLDGSSRGDAHPWYSRGLRQSPPS